MIYGFSANIERVSVIPILYEAAYNGENKTDKKIAMSRPFEIEIAESEEELKKRLQTANLGNQKEKLQMLWWIKSGQIKEQQEIAKRLAKDTSTVTRWLQKYRAGGIWELLSIKKAPGAKRKIHDEALAALDQELKTGNGFSSYGAIVEWLKQEQGLDVEYATVYAWVRYRLGAKLKVPRPQSHKQDEKLVSEFKKNSVSFSIA